MGGQIAVVMNDQEQIDAKCSQLHLLMRQYTLVKSLVTASEQCANKTQALALMFPLVDAIEELTSTLLEIARSCRMRDCYVISRTIYEGAVNACFILAGGEERGKSAAPYAAEGDS